MTNAKYSRSDDNNTKFNLTSKEKLESPKKVQLQAIEAMDRILRFEKYYATDNCSTDLVSSIGIPLLRQHGYDEDSTELVNDL